jgi:hypothetical protein
MPVAQRWELALNGAGAPGAACLWYSSLHTPQQIEERNIIAAVLIKASHMGIYI